MGEVCDLSFERQEAVFERVTAVTFLNSPDPWDLLQSSSVIEHI